MLAKGNCALVNPKGKSAQLRLEWLRDKDAEDNWTSVAIIPPRSKDRRLPPIPPTPPKNVVAEALALKAMLDTGEFSTQRALAIKIGITPARLTQKLQILKLPESVLLSLSDNHDDDTHRIFTERRLRSLIRLRNAAKIKKAFLAIKTKEGILK